VSDTERGLTDTMESLPVNTTGEITSQVHRDSVLSIAPAHGALDLTAPDATVIAVAGTFVKAEGQSTARLDERWVSMPADLRLMYLGAPRRLFLITFTAVVQAQPGQTLGLMPFVNGVAVSGLSASGATAGDAAGAVVNLSGTWLLPLEEGDYVEPGVTNYSDTDDVTVIGLHMAILGSIL